MMMMMMTPYLSYCVNYLSMTVLSSHSSSHETASSSAECSRDKPPFSFVRGQDSTVWDIVWVLPFGHRSVSVSRHFFLQAPQCPCLVINVTSWVLLFTQIMYQSLPNIILGKYWFDSLVKLFSALNCTVFFIWQHQILTYSILTNNLITAEFLTKISVLGQWTCHIPASKQLTYSPCQILYNLTNYLFYKLSFLRDSSRYCK